MRHRYGNKVSTFVKRYRERKGITQKKLGEMLGYHAQYISNVERESCGFAFQFCQMMLDILNDDEQRYFLDLFEAEYEDHKYNMMKRSKKRRRKKKG